MEIPRIIAEIGFNHAGDIELGRKMIEAAAKAGADAVKFQTFKALDILNPDHEFHDTLEGAEMDLAAHQSLAHTASDNGVEFISTPFGPEAVEILNQVPVQTFKVASMDLTNQDLLAALAKTGKPLLVSTGMATLAEIAEAVEFLDAQNSGPVTLLHCMAKYPSEAGQLNLAAIAHLKEVFGLPVGYSDHHPGVNACLAAALWGAQVVETHFTLDTTWEGGDHYHSADPASLAWLVKNIKDMTLMRGDPAFFNSRPDREEAALFRRGLYAAEDLPAGRVLSRDDLLLCRPLGELTPSDLPWVLGRELKKTLVKLAPLTRADV